MRALISLGLGLLALLFIYLLLCLFGKGVQKIDVVRSIEIDTPSSVPFQKVADFKQWADWSPWHKLDPKMQITYSDAPAYGKGAWYSWTSNHSQVGNGRLENIEFEQNKFLKHKMNFMAADAEPSYASFKFEDLAPNKTKVTWDMQSEFKVPFLRRGMMLFMDMNKIIERSYDMGLAKLKEVSESTPAQPTHTYRGFEVKEVEFAVRHLVGVRGKVSFDKISSFFENAYGKLMPALQANKTEPSGAPFGVYYQWDEKAKQTDLAACFPTAEKVNLGKGFEQIELPNGKAVLIEYRGDYAKSETAHFAMDDYFKAKNLKQKSPILEEYAIGPDTEKDTAKWLTRIYYFAE